ncbi:MAG: tetratricopeptide repeat protein [Bacillota bacterium]
MFRNLSCFYYNKGLRLAREDQLGPAVQSLTKAVAYNSDNIEAWNLAGLCYYRLGKYKTAEYCWTQSVNKRHEENAAGFYLADLRSTLEETGPSFSQVACLCRQEKYGQAAGILSREICSRFDLSTGLLNFLGVLWALDGKTNKAVKCWTTVLSLDKSNADAMVYLDDMEKRLSYKLLKWKEKLFRRNDI